MSDHEYDATAIARSWVESFGKIPATLGSNTERAMVTLAKAYLDLVEPPGVLKEEVVTINPECKACFNTADGWTCGCVYGHPLLCSAAKKKDLLAAGKVGDFLIAPANPTDDLPQVENVCCGCGEVNKYTTLKYREGDADLQCTECGSTEFEEGETAALRRVIEQRNLADACAHVGVAPCGHSEQYLYTEDGGKHIVCLLCQRARFIPALEAIRDMAYYGNSSFHPRVQRLAAEALTPPECVQSDPKPSGESEHAGSNCGVDGRVTQTGGRVEAPTIQCTGATGCKSPARCDQYGRCLLK